jgi:hypothetical protein
MCVISLRRPHVLVIGVFIDIHLITPSAFCVTILTVPVSILVRRLLGLVHAII